jgi:hypothetical protein
MAKVNRAERGGPRPDASRRSPFVRLTELLAGIELGEPPINLAVGAAPSHSRLRRPGTRRACRALRPLSGDARHRPISRRPRPGRPQRGSPGAERHRAKFDLADTILANRLGYSRPDGGFFLWLDVSEPGDLWRSAGLRVVPGSYLAQPAADGNNPGAGYIRLALVDDLNTTQEALTRLATWAG